MNEIVAMNQSQINEQDIVLFDEGNPRSIINLVPPKISELIKAAINKRPELFGLGESELILKLRGLEKAPSISDRRVRIKFWDEYEFAQHNFKSMTMNRVCAGVCLPEVFHRLLEKPEKVAFMLCPPHSYLVKVEEALSYAMDEMRVILEQPLVDPLTGKIDHKLANLKAKIAIMLDLRAKGAVVQRIEQVSKNFNLNMASSSMHKEVSAAALEESMETIEKRIKTLEKLDRLEAREIEAKEVVSEQ